MLQSRWNWDVAQSRRWASVSISTSQISMHAPTIPAHPMLTALTFHHLPWMIRAAALVHAISITRTMWRVLGAQVCPYGSIVIVWDLCAEAGIVRTHPWIPVPHPGRVRQIVLVVANKPLNALYCVSSEKHPLQPWHMCGLTHCPVQMKGACSALSTVAHTPHKQQCVQCLVHV